MINLFDHMGVATVLGWSGEKNHLWGADTTLLLKILLQSKNQTNMVSIHASIKHIKSRALDRKQARLPRLKIH